MQPETSGVKTWQWVVTVIVIIILIVLGYYMFKGNNAIAPATTDTSDSTTLNNTKDMNRVVITDQFPGNIVYISSAQLSNGGFVAIHKDNKGTPGDIIGSQYFEKGINPGKITLTTPTVEGGIYYAMIHTDDGDKKFDVAKDLPMKDASGSIIMKLFRATTSVTEVKG